MAGVAGAMQPPEAYSSEEGQPADRMRTQPVCRICPYSADADSSIDPNRRQYGARCSEIEIEGDPLAREWAARAPQSRRVGEAAIFPRAVSGRSFLLWLCRSRLSSTGGSQALTPGSGAWLFPDCLCGSRDMNQRGRRARAHLRPAGRQARLGRGAKIRGEPALSEVEGPALSEVEGPALSEVEGRRSGGSCLLCPQQEEVARPRPARSKCVSARLSYRPRCKPRLVL